MKVVLVPWALARLIVLVALVLARFSVEHLHPHDGAALARVHQGLLGWDAGWYQAIARVGYAPLGHQALRFFPLFPLLGRALGWGTGGHDGAWLVVVANLSALVATALLYVLVRRERGDADLARRSVWLFSLVPPAFVLVMGYAEATLLVWCIASFLALRRGSGTGEWHGTAHPAWWGAARAAAVAAALAPLAGLGVFLAWSARAFGDGWLPLRVQTQAGHHGGLRDPLSTFAHDARGVFHHHLGTALHLPWVVLVAVLLVLCWQRWPASYGAFATAVVLVAVSGSNLDSFERYAISAFPLILVGAGLLTRPVVERTVLVLAALGMAGYAVLAFSNVVVP
jgi:hypothetical protein